MNYSKTNLQTAQKVPFDLEGRIMFRSEKAEVVHLTLQPGEGMEMHVQPFDVVFFVLEGNATLAVGEEVLTASANDCLCVREGVMRAWKNGPDDVFRLLVCKLLK